MNEQSTPEKQESPISLAMQRLRSIVKATDETAHRFGPMLTSITSKKPEATKGNVGGEPPTTTNLETGLNEMASILEKTKDFMLDLQNRIQL